MSTQLATERAFGCSMCVLPAGYEGIEFLAGRAGDGPVCSLCAAHQAPHLRGAEQLLADLSLGPKDRVGITVSGGKDSLFAWHWLVQNLGPDRVVAFNHHKVGLTHPLAERNLRSAQEALRSQLVRVHDADMLRRFRTGLAALLAHPDPAMVRVLLCAGCRYGISGRLFAAGRQRGITTFVNASSDLELAPFKAALLRKLGDDDERRGLHRGLRASPISDHPDIVRVILRDDQHCHSTELRSGRSRALYPDIRYVDFHDYLPNDPARHEAQVRQHLGWERPENGWHFDCRVEVFKNALYHTLLGYTELDGYLSAMVRDGLLSRNAAIAEVVAARRRLADGRHDVSALMGELGVTDLIPRLDALYDASPFVTPPPSRPEATPRARRASRPRRLSGSWQARPVAVPAVRRPPGGR